MSRMSVARGPYAAALWLCVVSACSGSDGVQLFGGAAGHPGGSSNLDASSSAAGDSAQAGGSAGSSAAGGPSNGAGGAGAGAPMGGGGASATSLDGSAGTAMSGQVDAGRAADGSAGGSGGADAAAGGTGGNADAGAKGGSSGSAGASGGSADAGAKGGSAGAAGGSGGNAGATGGSGGNDAGATGGAAGVSIDGGTAVADASTADASTADVVVNPPPDAAGPPLDCESNRDCSSSQYCHKSSCGARARGTCERRPSECPAGRAAPVCGCDGVTYFDACLAASAGQSTSMDGACRETALHCRSALDLSCASVSGYCAILETDESACGGFGAPEPWVGVATGLCWVVPARCSSEEPPSYVSCGGRSGHCLTTCEAVKEGTQMYRDSACR